MYMVEVKERKAIRVWVTNRVGELAKVLAPIAEAKINVEVINAATLNDAGYLTLVTDNNQKALKLWEDANLTVKEVDLVAVGVPNRAGELAAIANRLSRAGIDISSLCSAGLVDNQYWVLLTTANNAEAIRAIRA